MMKKKQWIFFRERSEVFENATQTKREPWPSAGLADWFFVVFFFYFAVQGPRREWSGRRRGWLQVNMWHPSWRTGGRVQVQVEECRHAGRSWDCGQAACRPLLLLLLAVVDVRMAPQKFNHLSDTPGHPREELGNQKIKKNSVRRRWNAANVACDATVNDGFFSFTRTKKNKKETTSSRVNPVKITHSTRSINAGSLTRGRKHRKTKWICNLTIP